MKQEKLVFEIEELLSTEKIISDAKSYLSDPIQGEPWVVYIEQEAWAEDTEGESGDNDEERSVQIRIPPDVSFHVIGRIFYSWNYPIGVGDMYNGGTHHTSVVVGVGEIDAKRGLVGAEYCYIHLQYNDEGTVLGTHFSRYFM